MRDRSRLRWFRDAPGFTKGGEAFVDSPLSDLGLKSLLRVTQPDGESLTLGSSNFDEVSSRFRRGSVIVYYAW